MEQASRFLVGLVGLLVGVALTVWFLWRTLKKSEDPARIAFKWIVTAVLFFALIAMTVSMGRNAVLLPGIGAIFGVVLGILWAPHLGGALAGLFTGLYDGGDQEVEARPFYAIARAKQKRGNYQESIAEIRKQLAKFPEDYEGWMLLAEVYANDLKDHEAAQQCIQEILSHEGHAPRNIAFALNRSADWFLSLASDRDRAREALERIMLLFPDSESAHSAAQRIAHLTSDKMLAEQKERPRIAMPHHEENIGLRGEIADPRPPEEEPVETASRLVERLAQFPEDVEAREELAKVYANQFQRIDLARDQLEQLVAMPGAGQKEIARWLNMLADFHIRIDQQKEGAREALKRIVALFPNTALAAKAESRMAYLETELLKNKKNQALKLGSYETNLGLKGSVPSEKEA